MSELALQLIAENKKTKSPFLDLGNCGLEYYLPNELLDCVWLKQLNLGSLYYNISKQKWEETSNRQQGNRFSGSELIILEKLTNLNSLDLSDNKITDIRFLEKLTSLKSLDLSDNQITDNRFFEKLTNLNSLDLSSNKIKSIRFLEKLTNLNSLTLINNQITDIRILEKLTNLNFLDLRENQITDIQSLEKLTNLKSLDLSDNLITDISFLEKLTNLNSLNLFNNQIINIGFLQKLINLNSLDLSGNQITDIQSLENLTNLKSLDLSRNQITDTQSLEKLTSLNSLDLSNNQITDTQSLEKLTSLNSLDLSNNQITDTQSLEKLTSLNTLILSRNQITDIRSLEKLTNLNSLNLSRNQITDFQVLEKLTNLNSLNLSRNQITDFQVLEKLTNLNSLDLSDNQITNIQILEKLTSLKSLDLSRNQITDFQVLEKLFTLKRLDLSNNQIIDIRFLEKLTSLNSLNLSSNQITDTQSLENLIELYDLNLNHNQINDITTFLLLIQNGMSISLKEDSYYNSIQLYNNPISTPPLHIIELGNEAILRYFNAGNFKPLNECKLIFVGEGGVGKTCLMKRIVENTFDDNEKQTHGINKIAWEEIKNKNGENVKVNLWDFGGQDIQHSLHQFFFTERVIYVLVLNPRNDEKAAYWLEQIDKLGANSEVLVVYNWKDLTDLQAPYMSNFYELRKKYSKLPEPFVLSVKTGEGVDDFREKVKKAILQNEGLVQEYPEKWFNIKQKLEENVSIGENFINYETYENWCNNFDYKDESDQKALLVTLDKIGSIVFFNKPILNSLQVLNPEWITTGAYAILTSKLTKEKNGHLTITDLTKIFKEEKEIFSNKEIKIKYNEHQFQFIIQLMLSYDLCQENPFKKHEYLIPAAFGAKPNNNYDAHKQDARNYRIQFDSPFEMLIMHRFIAKNLSKVQGKDYWQSGIFIKDNSSNTFALVETNLHSSRIDFWIKGDNIRGFWEAMRRDFQEIFSIYKKFSYREEVLYKQDNREVFLPYQEMLDSLLNKVSIISYHPTYQLKNINVLAVLDLFEDAKATERKIEKERTMANKGDTFIINGNFESSQLGGRRNRQKNNFNTQLSDLNEFNEIKEILLELKEANVHNELWKITLIKCLDEFSKLDEVEDKSTQKGIIDTSFTFLKDVKDVIDVSFLPLTVNENIHKLIELWNAFKVNH
ncbi:leucine-rich repeat domain-containing protein [Arcicella sp. DC2W]|uniref:non-specific serine/threonine protein kinase n=1 Tax=Arcicella gelida TaxID=2984195 RepID=A0ABU5S1M2_9BACT|nr:leucine-rich repeat domain-containing protein [Arcicella sp. DC2W]MEA5402281.1 leucine-rich repeat domain-containing protein [Arcicella sp. DC2W]